MVERERQARGEGNARHKLYEDEVLEIRALYAAGGGTYEQLGRRYGVSDSQIARIVKGQRWRYLVSGEAA